MCKRSTRQDALQVLRLLNLFNEKEIYGLVLDYLFTGCTISQDMPWNQYGIGVRDIVGGPAFSRYFFAVRFCFSNPATFEQLRAVDIGLTTRSEPFGVTHYRGYIDGADATYFTTTNLPNDEHSTESLTVLSILYQGNQGNQKQLRLKCSVHSRLAYAEILYDCENQKMTVNLACINHVNNSIILLTNSMDVPQEFHNSPLYPFLSIRIPPPFAISIHSLL